MTVRLRLVDDNDLVRTGRRMSLETEAGVEIVGKTGTGG